MRPLFEKRRARIERPVVLAAAFSWLVLAPNAVHAQPYPIINAPHHVWFDLDATLGVGTMMTGKDRQPHYLASVRLGISMYTPYWVVTTGALARMVDFEAESTKVGLGLQVEAIHIMSGLWGYGGPYVDFKGQTGFTIGVGWSVFVLEMDAFEDGNRVSARWFFKLRIPLSVGAYVLWRRRHLKKRIIIVERKR